ncbi:hypothetical protein HN51_063434 [Arachis hypogaea]
MSILVGRTRFEVFVSEMRNGGYASMGCTRRDRVDWKQGLCIGGGPATMGSKSNAAVNCSEGQLTREDEAAAVILPLGREEEQMKGRIVISSEVLNEWSNVRLISKTVTPIIREIDLNMAQADIAGSPLNGADDDSDRTVSWDFADGQIHKETDITSSARRSVDPVQANYNPTGIGAQYVISKEKDYPLGFTLRGPPEGLGDREELDWVANSLEREPTKIRPKELATGDSRNAAGKALQDGADVPNPWGRPIPCAIFCSEEGVPSTGSIGCRGQGRRTPNEKGGRSSTKQAVDGGPSLMSLAVVGDDGRTETLRATDIRPGREIEMVVQKTGPELQRNTVSGCLGVAEMQRDADGLRVTETLVMGSAGTGEDMDNVGDERLDAEEDADKIVIMFTLVE